MFIIELMPPNNPANLIKFFDKISNVVKKTKRVSIVSKPSGLDGISGFKKSIRLAQFLLGLMPDLDIVFHLTCRDLNKVNIETRLVQLRDLNISKILVISGDQYTCKPPSSQSYENSTKLLEDITKHYDWFQSIAVAGYPGGNGCQSYNNEQECKRLSIAFKMGAKAVYTQCVFDAKSFEDFNHKIKETFVGIEVIPSVALFKSAEDLEKVIGLTRVNSLSLAEIRSHLRTLDKQESESYCLSYLVRLCTNISNTIDLCPFGQFDFAELLIGELDKTVAP